MTKQSLSEQLKKDKAIFEILIENQNDEQKIEQSVFYHATFRPYLKKIKDVGLGAGKIKKNWSDSKSGVVYLALDPYVAESYAEESETVPDSYLDKIVILQIDGAQLDMTKMKIDNNVQDNNGDTLEYHGIIPKTAISLYNRD